MCGQTMQATRPHRQARRAQRRPEKADRRRVGIRPPRKPPDGQCRTFGDYRYNDQLDDLSVAEVLRQDKVSRDFLARLDAIDVSGFPEQEQLNKALLERKLRQGIEDTELKRITEMPPSDQFNRNSPGPCAKRPRRECRPTPVKTLSRGLSCAAAPRFLAPSTKLSTSPGWERKTN